MVSRVEEVKTFVSKAVTRLCMFNACKTVVTWITVVSVKP